MFDWFLKHQNKSPANEFSGTHSLSFYTDESDEDHHNSSSHTQGIGTKTPLQNNVSFIHQRQQSKSNPISPASRANDDEGALRAIDIGDHALYHDNILDVDEKDDSDSDKESVISHMVNEVLTNYKTVDGFEDPTSIEIVQDMFRHYELRSYNTMWNNIQEFASKWNDIQYDVQQCLHYFVHLDRFRSQPQQQMNSLHCSDPDCTWEAMP
eukprot:276016_1